MALTNRAYSLFPCASCPRETAVKVSFKKKKKNAFEDSFSMYGGYVDVSNRAVQSVAKVREVKGNLFDRENQVKENFVHTRYNVIVNVQFGNLWNFV